MTAPAPRCSPRHGWPGSRPARGSSTPHAGTGVMRSRSPEGYHVVGLDRSVTQLDEARRRRGAANGPRLVRADYREIPLATGAFDGALSRLSSLGYAGDAADGAVLAEIRRVLRPGGRLVIETNHRDRLPPRSPLREWYPLPDGAFLLTESRVDRVGGTVEFAHTYLPGGGPPQNPDDPLAGLLGYRARPDPRRRGLRRDRLLREPRWRTLRGRHAPRHRGSNADVTGGGP